MKPHPTVLIIDSEKAIRRLLKTVLEPAGYRVFEADTGGEGLARAVEFKPDVLILEMALSDGSGLKVLESLREWNWTPVLVLSDEINDEIKVAALDAGANDYLAKPFSSLELLARLRVLQRPLPNVPDGPLFIDGGLVANLSTHEITIRGQPVSLTPQEEALFFVLARYSGKVVTRAHLVQTVWGLQSGGKNHDLQVLVATLRKKLGPCGGELLLKTEGSLGYRLSFSAQADQPAGTNLRNLASPE